MSTFAENPVRLVIVGAGSMGRAWMRTVLRSKRARLVGVVDLIEGAAAAAVADVLPEPRRGKVFVGTDLLKVSQEAGAEAIVDVTIPAAHHSVTAEALHAGLAVLGEKPCAATLAEALSLAGHAETTGKLFMISQSRRHNPHLLEASRLAKYLGGAGIVSTFFSRGPRFGGFRDQMAQPLIVDMAIHAFDAGRVLIEGRPTSVDATSYNPPWSWYEGDAAATVTIRYESGAVHTYTGSWCSPGRETSWNGEWEISCPEGTIAWDGESVPLASSVGGNEVAAQAPDDNALWELDSSLDEFCLAFRAGSVPGSEVHSNVWTQAIVEAAVRSADEGRRVPLVEMLEEALAQGRALDALDGRSAALEAWDSGVPSQLTFGP